MRLPPQGGLPPCNSVFGPKFNIFFLQNGIRYRNDFFCMLFVYSSRYKYIYMKSSKKNLRGIVVLERDLVGKLEPKSDHDFSIPGRLKQKSAKQFKSKACWLSFGIYVFQHFEMKQNDTYF